MALPVIPNVFRCAVRQSVAGQSAVNVFHVVDLTTPTAQEVAEGVAAAWGATGSICSLQTTAVDLEGVDVTPLDGVTPTVSAGFGGADNDTGTRSAFAMPAGDCLVVSLKSAQRGRSKNGRMYISGCANNMMVTSQQAWSATTISDAATAFGVFFTELDTDPLSSILCIASYKLEEAFDVVAASAKAAVASQRRRDH